MPSSKIRKQIYLDQRLDRLVKQQAKRSGRSQAEVIRDALSCVLDKEDKRPELKAWKEFKSFCESRRALNPQGAKSERTWKREDLYEERLKWPRNG